MKMKQKLDTPGVQAVVAHIYAQTAAEQAIIRQSIRSDLRSWLPSHFMLNRGQSSYLDAMSDEALASAGELVADALEDQLDFLFTASTAEEEDEPKGKEILMGPAGMQRVGPMQEEENLFLITVNYYGKKTP